ncbi:hypothetical protein TD95_002433 [Thielaviopsis punctulata]|uniref:Gylcosyl hydrolase 115 C-terminal domain-containing protein n=1 Tax=Thielaviopsis punctulata TaxID=72032 RepID=A0A0F4ZCG6_9PEZI|nr:hypothetical protein TD95_002433 [Thielaviopsis punctulata]
MRYIASILAASLVGTVRGLGQEPIISFTASNDSFQIAGSAFGSTGGQILVSSDDYWGVIRAAGDLAVDFGRVTGTNYTLSNGEKDASAATYEFLPVDISNNTIYRTTAQQNFTGPAYSEPDPEKTVIIAGTLGRSPTIDALVSSGKLNVSAIANEWESFVSAVISNPVDGVSRALVIAGSDARGTIYGIYDVSEQIGVSPWYFWADSPVRRKTEIWALPGPKVQKAPSVKYRGLFLNDEQPALSSWVGTNFPDAWNGSAGFNHNFYRLIFELLLRLRANYLWPALWASIFYTDDPLNQPLADAFEIVLGSSHTEPMMRAQNEFKTYYTGPWAYNLNNKTIDAYFRYGAQRAKPYTRNSLYTMAMRGTGDTEIEGGLGLTGIIDMLEVLVHKQQEIIVDVLQVENSSVVPQMWCLYKEVQTYQEQGLHVPEDITLLWSDDNWGNVRRLPLKNETGRAGGAGVYYHFDYVGDPRDYKWINTVQLQKTAEQLWLAYKREADRIWVVNVGDLKGLELPLNHYFDLAYDAPRWGLHGTSAWTHAWATREFGPELAANISTISNHYGMLAARRKYELVNPQTYSLINYNEADAVLGQWADLHSAAQKVYDALDAQTKDAFYETLLHPILAAENLYRIQIAGTRNQLYAWQKRNSANDVVQESLELLAEDSALTDRWDGLRGGKWAHFMDQTHLGYDYWQQPMRNALPPMTYVQTTRPSVAGQLGIGVEASNATVSGDDRFHALSSNTLSLPPLSRYGPRTRWLDVFSRGTQKCAWNASVSVDWLTLQPSSGAVGPDDADVRMHVSVNWERVPQEAQSGEYTISFKTCRGLERFGFGEPSVTVPVDLREVPKSFEQGFVEADGVVAIEAPHYQAIVPGTKSSLNYTTLSDYGRVLGGVGLADYGMEKLESVGAGPALEYKMYFFSNATANVTLYLSPTQNYMDDSSALEYAIGLFPAGSNDVDYQRVTPVGAFSGANMPPGWNTAVADSAWGVSGTLTTSSFKVTESEYVLRIYALLPSVVVQKVIVDLGGLRRSYLGPPESFLVGRDELGKRELRTFRDTPGVF